VTCAVFYSYLTRYACLFYLHAHSHSQQPYIRLSIMSGGRSGFGFTHSGKVKGIDMDALGRPQGMGDQRNQLLLMKMLDYHEEVVKNPSAHSSQYLHKSIATACLSLYKCPLRIVNGRAAMDLSGVGKVLAAKITNMCKAIREETDDDSAFVAPTDAVTAVAVGKKNSGKKKATEPAATAAAATAAAAAPAASLPTVSPPAASMTHAGSSSSGSSGAFAYGSSPMASGVQRASNADSNNSSGGGSSGSGGSSVGNYARRMQQLSEKKVPAAGRVGEQYSAQLNSKSMYRATRPSSAGSALTPTSSQASPHTHLDRSSSLPTAVAPSLSSVSLLSSSSSSPLLDSHRHLSPAGMAALRRHGISTPLVDVLNSNHKRDRSPSMSLASSPSSPASPSFPSSPQVVRQATPAAADALPVKKARGRPKAGAAAAGGPVPPSGAPPPPGRDGIEANPPPVKKAKGKAAKTPAGPRIPKTRSGGWAILLALIRDEIDVDECESCFHTSGGVSNSGDCRKGGYMTKKQLMDAAAPFCDASLHAAPGEHYSAWNNMSGLVTKAWIIKWSNPARYVLTEAGREMAMRVREQYEGSGARRASSLSSSPSSSASSSSSSSSSLSSSSSSSSPSPSSVHTQFDLKNMHAPSDVVDGDYVDDDYDYDPNDFDMYEDQPLSYVNSRSSSSAAPSGSLSSSPAAAAAAGATESPRPHLKSTDFDIILLLDVRERNKQAYAGSSKNANNGTNQQLVQQLQAKGIMVEGRALEIGDMMWIARSKHAISLPIRHPSSLSSSSSSSSSSSAMSPPAVREIVLDCIVERKRADDLMASLKSGHQAEQRSRLLATNLTRIVYLIEGSISSYVANFSGGNRFGRGGGGLGGHQSGSAAGALRTEAACEKTLSSLLIDYGCMVYRTADHAHSMRVLEMLNNLVKQEYIMNGVALPFASGRVRQAVGGIGADMDDDDDDNDDANANANANPVALMRRTTSTGYLDPQRFACEEYRNFATRLRKTQLSTSLLFGTQLRCISGVSAEKAAAIIHEYPTAHHLYTAYEAAHAACASEYPDADPDELERKCVEREQKMLAGMEHGHLVPKKLGQALSSKIRNFFRLEQYVK
jgi:ERCC4-type nuclease